MGGTQRIYLFGDQTFDIHDCLYDLVQVHDNPILSAFFERSCCALRRQISEFDSIGLENLVRFSSIAELNALQQKEKTNPAISQFLTCVCQLGIFIRLHGAHGLEYPSGQNSCLVGLCTGTLAAAAVSSSSSLLELLDAAVEATIVAFKVGLCSWDASRRIDCNASNAGKSWALAVSGTTLKQASNALEEITEAEHIPRTSRPYISLQSSSTQLTISGLPDSLEKLRQRPFFSTCTSLYLPVHAPYHAPHLFSQVDIEQVYAGVLSPRSSSQSRQVPVIPTSTRDDATMTNFRQTMRHAVAEILARPLNWDAVLEQTSLQIQNGKFSSVEFIPIATTADRCIRPAIEKLLSAREEPNATMTTLNTLRPDLPEPLSTSPSRIGIAILSVSGRFPSASGMEELWSLLERGLDVHSVVPPTRWDASTHFDQALSRKNTSGTPYGCWLEDAGLWDARFFNVSPREAPQVDPAQRVALLTAAEAIERAGIVPDRTPSTRKDRVGVWYGCTSNDWMETNSAQDIDAYFIPGGNRAFIPGRINYHYKFSGPSYTIDTACSSSFAAIHMACNALWRGEVDTAITGGTNVLTNPDMTAGLDRGHFLSRTGNCQTFDENADGYCRGEGVATIILKRLDDALTDKDPIIGVIRGIATNHSAEAASITRPHVGAQRELFEKIMNSASIRPNDISYVEMHGTGTQAGDAGETASVLETFAPLEPRKKRAPHQSLHIGSVKANLGHGEAAAGVTSLAKVLLMLKNSVIPPHCGIKGQINRNIPELGPRNTLIAKTPVPWPRPANSVRRVFLNNFSAAGGNTALVMEDGPLEAVSSDVDPREVHVLTLSAKTYTSLEGNLNAYISWIDRMAEEQLTLPRASYTSTVRRIHYPHRVAVTGSTLPEIRTQLQQCISRQDGSSRPKSSPEICFTFTGQGSQYHGMGAELFSHFSSFRDNIIRYDQLAQGLGFPSIIKVFENSISLEGLSPVAVQLASTCLQMALTRLFASWGIRPHAVIGHSLGEYAALNAANVISESDTIYLVGTRASLLERHCAQDTHAMLATRASLANIQDILGLNPGAFEVSCFNSAEDIVLGGTREELERASANLSQGGVRATTLDVPFAFHTSQVNPILKEFQELSKGVNFRAPSLPVISPLIGGIIRPECISWPEYLSNHCRKTVNVVDAVEVAKREGIISEKTVAIEIGPAPVVSKMLRKVVGSTMKSFHCLQKGHNPTALLPSICASLYSAGADINWVEYHRDFKSSHKVLDLPTYCWDLKNYWIQYINDWSLRKGDPIFEAASLKLESSTVHRVTKEDIRDLQGELIIESDLSHADMHSVVQGHKVWGVPLCTPSVYADIALTVGHYLHQRYQKHSSQGNVEVGPMNIQSALVANSEGAPQILRAVFEVNFKKNISACTFSSVDTNGKIIEQHSNCSIRFFNIEDCKQQLDGQRQKITSQIDTIQRQISHQGNTYRFSKSMIYKMITQLADFDPNYRGLVEITLDNDKLEAFGRVSFKDVKKGGDFHTNPAYIDALSQLGGFVMNANENVDLEKEVFINHGWDSMRLFEAIDDSKTYETFVSMHETEGNLWKGDVIILESKRIIGVFGGVALQGVPKRLMQVIVDSANKRSQRKQTSSKIAAAPVQTFPIPAMNTNHLKARAESLYISRSLRILSEESGIALEELTDNTQLSDIGIDSLLSLVIGSRYRDELNIDIESSTLIDFSTIQDLKKFIGQHAPKDSEVHDSAAVALGFDAAPSLPAQPTVPETTATWSIALKIISEESGIRIEELTDDTAFADIGVDSLLALVIGSRYRDELDLDLPSDASLFIDNQTIKDLRDCLFHDVDSHASDTNEPSSASSPRTELSSSDTSFLSEESSKAPQAKEVKLSHPEDALEDDTNDNMLLQTVPEIQSAWSMVLQGAPKRAEKILFLFPDGCGAASSYLGLPRISPSVAVIGFNSPFMKNPTEMQKYPLASIVSSYVRGVRRHQPHGPYYLGGWSAGGILAYAVSSVLMGDGEQVSALMCIDSPAPTKGLDRLPQRFFDHCSKVGLFGTELAKNSQKADVDESRRTIPEWLMPHFHATIEALHDFIALPMPDDWKAPKLSLLWAGECALDGIRYPQLPPATHGDEDTAGMKFLTEKRIDFGPGDWAMLFPKQEVVVETAYGEDHFSMMRGAGAQQIATVVRKAMNLTS